MLKKIAKLLILLIAIWLIFAVIIEIMGITIYFPFHISSDHEIPYHRWQTVRLSVFLTFAYFSIRYLIWGGIKLYPAQFLDVYMKLLTVTAILLFIRTGVIKTDFMVLIYFAIISLGTHIASRPKYRNYFIK